MTIKKMTTTMLQWHDANKEAPSQHGECLCFFREGDGKAEMDFYRILQFSCERNYWWECCIDEPYPAPDRWAELHGMVEVC